MAEGGAIPLVLICLIVLLPCDLGSSASDGEDWEKQQLVEIKLMLSGLNAKMASVEGKLSHFNVLDYAFKTNTIDTQVKSLSARMDQLFTQVDLVRSFQVQACVPSTNPPQTGENSRRSSAAEQERSMLRDTAEKLDDYGKKLLRSHHNLTETTNQQAASLSAISDTVRSGFSKVVAKLDRTMEVEGQMSNAIGILQQLSAKTTAISESMAHLSKGLASVESVAETNQNQLTKLGKGLNEISRTSSEVAFPVSGLTRAIELGNDLEVQVAQLTSVDQKISKASSLSKDLQSGMEEQGRSAGLLERAKDPNSLLKEIENVSLPISLSAPYLLDNLRAVLGDALTTMANRSRCEASQVTALEIRRLRDALDGTVASSRQQGPGVGSGARVVLAQCADAIQAGLERDRQFLSKDELREFMTRVPQLVRQYKPERGMPKDRATETLGMLIG